MTECRTRTIANRNDNPLMKEISTLLRKGVKGQGKSAENDRKAGLVIIREACERLMSAEFLSTIPEDILNDGEYIIDLFDTEILIEAGQYDVACGKLDDAIFHGYSRQSLYVIGETVLSLLGGA